MTTSTRIYAGGLMTMATRPRVRPIADYSARVAMIARSLHESMPMLEIDERNAAIIDGLTEGQVVTLSAGQDGKLEVSVKDRQP